MDKLTALKTAIDEILDDDHVTPEGEGYRIQRDDDINLLVLPHGPGQGWAVYWGTSTPDDRRPSAGLIGSQSASVKQAVAWALMG